MAGRVEEDGARRGYAEEEARRPATWKEIRWGRRSSRRAGGEGEREPHRRLSELAVAPGSRAGVPPVSELTTGATTTERRVELTRRRGGSRATAPPGEKGREKDICGGERRRQSVKETESGGAPCERGVNNGANSRMGTGG
jgi:hypothetical protein